MFVKLYRAWRLLRRYPYNPGTGPEPIAASLYWNGKELRMQFDLAYQDGARTGLFEASLDEVLAMNKARGFEREPVNDLGWENNELREHLLSELKLLTHASGLLRPRTLV